MREDLVGYLLAALEPHEMRRIEQQLLRDAALREELEYVQSQLEPLDRAIAAVPVFETPTNLIAKTLAAIPPSHFGSAFDLAGPGAVAMMRPAVDSRSSFMPRRSDWIVAAVASFLVLALLLPTVARGRYEARKVLCQQHLRQFGTAFTQYVMHNQDHSLPQIASSGPEAFAGIYVPRLAESELLTEPALRLCPATPLTRPKMTLVSSLGSQPIASRIIKLNDLKDASEAGKLDELRWMQETAGGDFAYNLGVVDGGRYAAPHYEGRTTFAVLGDAPIAGTESADDVDVTKLRWAHGSAGANILFEDGSVRFVDMSAASQFPDHPFFNHRGSIEAGVNIDDASLAPSWRSPFMSARQR